MRTQNKIISLNETDIDGQQSIMGASKLMTYQPY